MTVRVGWLDCSSGVSGDMLLGALHELGALEALAPTLAAVPELGARLTVAEVRRGALRATHVTLHAEPGPPRNRVAVQSVLDQLPVPHVVRARAGRIFDRLAVAESAVHGVRPDEIHFHEIGAVDSIVDVVGACLGFDALGLDELTVSPVALGSGTVDSLHGPIPVPGPAVLELLRGTALEVIAGHAQTELATPTGVAIVAELAGRCGDIPAMTVTDVGTGAGTRDSPARPNVARLIVGERAESTGDEWLLFQANIDDFDPRLWPGVIDTLLGAGAADAWLTPILMKKGRPAHTLSVLAAEASRVQVERAIFEHTTTIGLRITCVQKRALDRESINVEIAGCTVRVKVARLGGTVVTATPEWVDIEAAARALGRPAKDVLADATAAARRLIADGLTS